MMIGGINDPGVIVNCEEGLPGYPGARFIQQILPILTAQDIKGWLRALSARKAHGVSS